MKLHTSWLAKYLDRPIPPRELVDAMPRAGLEVEAEQAAGDGYQIELKVLPNRPDCLGVLGIAREMAALFGANVVWPDATMPTPAGDERVAVEITEPDLCRRFTAAAFRGVKVGPSPAWLADALRQAGVRPINNVVDVTNFVMWETGQPLHAFDLSKLAGPKIVVRRLRAGESLQLLSGKTITEKYGQPLCVCDAERPQALAGVMGGKDSETTGATADVLLEAAYFDPVHVRANVKTLRRIDGTGGTDASYRFERGVDPNAMLDYARRRAYTLIADLAGGRLAGPPTDVVAKATEPRAFALSAERVSRLIGTRVDVSVAADALGRLGYQVKQNAAASGTAPAKALAVNSQTLHVTVPTFRVDVNDAVVLAEDVARMIGYDNIAAESRPARATRGHDCPAGRLRAALTRALVDAGWLETKNDPLESGTKSATWLGPVPDALLLSNAASTEMNALRRTLLGGLLASAQRNVFRGVAGVRLFEIDRTFARLPGEWTLAGVCGGLPGPTAWRAATPVDFFTLKGAIEDALDAAGLRGLGFSPADRTPGLVGATAAVELNGKTIGFVGEIDNALAKVERLSFKLFGFELDLSAVLPAFERPVTHTPLNRQPAVDRDLALVLRKGVAFADVMKTVWASGGGLLVGLDLADEYVGKQVAEGQRSLALRLTFRDAARTLTADEVTAAVAKVVEKLGQSFGATLRT